MATPANAPATAKPSDGSRVIRQRAIVDGEPIVTTPADDVPLLVWSSRLPPLLAFIAGMVDVTGFFTLGNVFTAHITGNLAVVSAVAAQGKAPSLVQSVMIPVFIFAVAATWLLARVSNRSRRTARAAVAVVQFLLLTVLAVFCVVTTPSLEPTRHRGRICGDDRGLRHGLPVRALPHGAPRFGLDSRHDRQSDQYRPLLDGSVVRARQPAHGRGSGLSEEIGEAASGLRRRMRRRRHCDHGAWAIGLGRLPGMPRGARNRRLR